MTPATRLAEFARQLTFKRLPEAVVANAKLRILDTVGIALASTRQDFAPSVLRATAELGTAPAASTIIGTTRRAPAAVAALANGALAHGLDFDDTHAGSITHASACVVPTALAMAEANHLSGRDALVAAVAGWETIVRVGAAAPNAFHARGFHATAVCGTFATTLVAARSLRLSTAQTVSALGIAGSMAAGIFEYLADGSWVKRLHPGWAGHAGVSAALLARHGFTGPATVFEGRFGLFRTHLDDAPYDVSRLTKGLGEAWETLDISFKPYPCCHYNHAFIDATLGLVSKHAIRADDVEWVECRIAAGQVPIVCEPEETKYRPRTAYDAQFSLPYAVAVALADGRVGLDSFAPKRIREARVLSLAARVRHVVDPASAFPRVFPGGVKIGLRGGRVVEAYEPANRGCPENPLSPDDIRAKYRDNARRVLPAAAVARLEAAIERFERVTDVAQVMALCRVRAEARRAR